MQGQQNIENLKIEIRMLLKIRWTIETRRVELVI